MASHLFLASTPFNVLTAAMVAFELPKGDQAILGLIDQTRTTQVFRDILAKWPDSPFKQILLISEKVSNKQKRTARKEAFRNIDRCLTECAPDWIYTGNDRRIEFQYAMAHSPEAKGAYIDDGTYSYLGRPTSWFSDRIFDNLLKKATYGRWWKQPSQIGASEWIDKAIVAFPEMVIPEIRRRGCKQLPNNLDRSEFRSLTELAIQGHVEQLQRVATLVLLPHNSAVSDSQANLTSLLSKVNGAVFYKHHPRTEERYKTPEQLKNFWQLPSNSHELPSSTPIEIILPLLAERVTVIGGLSTALLTCKWLRPDLQVISMDREPESRLWLNLLLALGIRTAAQDNKQGELTFRAEHFIAAGRDRSCYRHPEYPDSLCIKVSPRDDTQSRREVSYYKKLINRNIPWDYISRYHGTVSTNLGRGEVFDYITNSDGSPAKTVRYYIKSREINIEDMKNILSPLIDCLMTNGILMKDMSDSNIVLKRVGDNLSPIIIDGLGDTLISLRSHISYFGRKQIEKSYQKMLTKLIREFGQ